MTFLKLKTEQSKIDLVFLIVGVIGFIGAWILNEPPWQNSAIMGVVVLFVLSVVWVLMRGLNIILTKQVVKAK